MPLNRVLINSNFWHGYCVNAENNFLTNFLTYIFLNLKKENQQNFSSWRIFFIKLFAKAFIAVILIITFIITVFLRSCSVPSYSYLSYFLKYSVFYVFFAVFEINGDSAKSTFWQLTTATTFNLETPVSTCYGFSKNSCTFFDFDSSYIFRVTGCSPWPSKERYLVLLMIYSCLTSIYNCYIILLPNWVVWQCSSIC